MIDVDFMRRALDLAARATGLTSPNPMVGAVIARDASVVGEGFHTRAGESHAEIEALRAAGELARGATLYVTLEPCAHQGRTPPCAPAVVAAGLARVVVATTDPNPVVNGEGVRTLRRAGLQVEVGTLAEEAEALNRVFFTRMREGRPHVTLKAAMTLDGKIADVDGESRWITGEDARREAHRLRSRSDGIAIGIGTAIRDDPQLTVRLDPPWPREPYRIVVDSQARLPTSARLIGAGTPARAIIAVVAGASPERVGRLRTAGVTVVECPGREGKVDLSWLLQWLAARDVVALLLEGGGELNAAFLESSLVDRVVFHVAPLLLGGRTATGAIGGPGRALKGTVRLRGLEVRRLGEDLVIEGDVAR
jgi:diaminohydroxyphosphoribosylaminopyrimidine deaminase/5-amino-6-(5-phosphoribosylamino)uracil reductase